MKRQYEDVPIWFAKTMENLDKENWQPDYACADMRNDFMRGFDRAAHLLQTRKQASSGIVDLVMTVGGRLLELTATLIPQPMMSPALRSRSATFSPTPPTTRPDWACFRQAGTNAHIRYALFRSERGEPEIEINLVERVEHTDIRPFTVSVHDESGAFIVEPIEVCAGELPPRFPSPSGGWYRFRLSWKDGRGDMVVRVEDIQ
ncbi:MAG: hypothetical protein Q4G66_13160 [bacterium]|nr:hypothetical protein [bacterium]